MDLTTWQLTGLAIGTLLVILLAQHIHEGAPVYHLFLHDPKAPLPIEYVDSYASIASATMALHDLYLPGVAAHLAVTTEAGTLAFTHHWSPSARRWALTP